MKTVWLALDHGLGVASFFNTKLADLLVDKGARLVFLVQDDVLPMLKEEHGEKPGFIFESLRLKESSKYYHAHMGGIQELLEYVRGASASPRIPITYVDTHRQRKEYEAKGKYKYLLIALRPLIYLLRSSSLARKLFRRSLYWLFTPHLYDDLYKEYPPDLIVSDTAGWRLDQYLLRDADQRGYQTATLIIGWDNPSSNGLPGAFVDYANVWSEIHRKELVEGVDWPSDKIYVGGMPLYDGYISRKWLIPKDEYFRMHGLDPNKRLISFAATALSITPNIHIIKMLAEMIGSQSLAEPGQLLIRLHPNHFKPFAHYQEEAEAVKELTRRYPDVHVVEPKPMGGNLERYSGEDYPEKSSMLAHSDVLVTIYSTMVVESALHDTPFISACIDVPGGWKGKYWVPLHEVPDWPTAARVNQANAGLLALTEKELLDSINAYLRDPELHAQERHNFIEQELTYLHGESTGKTADFLWSLVEEKKHDNPTL
jgi:hypothetical protein